MAQRPRWLALCEQDGHLLAQGCETTSTTCLDRHPLIDPTLDASGDYQGRDHAGQDRGRDARAGGQDDGRGHALHRKEALGEAHDRTSHQDRAHDVPVEVRGDGHVHGVLVEVRGDGHVHDVLVEVRGDDRVRDVLAEVRGDVHVHDVLVEVRGDDRVRDVLAEVRGDVHVHDVLVEVRGDDRVRDVLAEVRGDVHVHDVLVEVRGDDHVHDVLAKVLDDPRVSGHRVHGDVLCCDHPCRLDGGHDVFRRGLSRDLRGICPHLSYEQSLSSCHALSFCRDPFSCLYPCLCHHHGEQRRCQPTRCRQRRRCRPARSWAG